MLDTPLTANPKRFERGISNDIDRGKVPYFEMPKRDCLIDNAGRNIHRRRKSRRAQANIDNRVLSLSRHKMISVFSSVRRSASREVDRRGQDQSQVAFFAK
jgi:hypothetical protein